MNSVIEQQLKKCKVARIPAFNADTTKLEIKKARSLNGQSCIPGHYYIIRLENYLLHPTPDFNLHINWNRGIIPKSEGYKCEVVQVMSTMVKINGVGYDLASQQDLSDSWSGWLPLEGIEVIKEI